MKGFYLCPGKSTLLKMLPDGTRILLGPSLDGFACAIRHKGVWLKIVASWAGGWDHVSVSHGEDTKVPTWEEMCFVKDTFFHEDEWAVQYHPAKADYVNNHPGVLHLWRPTMGDIPKPPKNFV